MSKMPATFNHAFSFNFAISGIPDETGENITGAELRKAINCSARPPE
jgi:hypothetical protein